MRKSNSSLRLLNLTAIIAVLHAVDHILRMDHSGWPFRQGVSPFTYSLLAFPILVSVYLSAKGSLYRIIATAFLLVFATAAHILFEPLRDKFHTWTAGSDMAGHVGESNLLGIHSPVLGVISIGLAVALSCILVLTLLAFMRDRREVLNGTS